MKKLMPFFIMCLLISVFPTSNVGAEFVFNSSQITSSPNFETTPTLGHNDYDDTDYLVYTVRENLGGGALGPGEIYYQPVFKGYPSGNPVQVTSGPTDDQLNDCWGDYIVYTAYDSVTEYSGTIILYQISTRESHPLGTATIIEEPKIHGTRVVWRQGDLLASMVMYYEIGWLEYGYDARRLAGPVPPTFDIQIGSRFIVWAEFSGGTYDVYAYDIEDIVEYRVTNTPAIDERQPATSGDWIVWQQTDGSKMTIEAKNMLTMDRITIDNGAGNFNPSIEGDFIAWESNVTGNLDIWIYSLSSGQSYQATTGTGDQYLNDVFGSMVAYVDMGSGSEDVWISNWGQLRTPGYQPSGITYDGTYLYVAENSGSRKIYRLDPATGVLAPTNPEFLAPSPTGFDGNGNPSGLAYDGNGHLFVSDLGAEESGVLYEIDTVGTNIYNTFTLPFRAGGVAFDGSHIYVSNFDGPEIIVLDRNGNPFRQFNSPIRPAGLTYDPSTGHLLAISEFDNQISKITTDGQLVCQTTGPHDPGVQGIGGVTIVESELYITEVSDPDPFNPPEIAGTIYRVPIMNCPPIADAGQDQSVHPGTTVSLDGSGSSDPEGHYPLSYFWELEKPSGSNAELSAPASVNPSFTVDTLGEYQVRLVVTDSGGVQSEADEAIISTSNAEPVADAGDDQIVTAIGSTVYLDGTQSYDNEGDVLTYAWTIISKPEGSYAELYNAESTTPHFIADVYGDYTIQLIVQDTWGDFSAPDTVLVSFENVPPVADAGGSQAVWVGDTVYLDGTGSDDANGDSLSYAWEMVSRPAGSTSTIDTPLEAQASFIADTVGSYVISLVVNDGLVNSAPDNITVEALSVQEEAAKSLKAAAEIINDFDPSVFKNENMQTTLVNKINAVLKQIEQGLYQEALSKLQNDIIGKVDGCALTGAPDKNDMVQDCDAQAQLYPELKAALDFLLERV